MHFYLKRLKMPIVVHPEINVDNIVPMSGWFCHLKWFFFYSFISHRHSGGISSFSWRDPFSIIVHCYKIFQMLLTKLCCLRWWKSYVFQWILWIYTGVTRTNLAIGLFCKCYKVAVTDCLLSSAPLNFSFCFIVGFFSHGWLLILIYLFIALASFISLYL